MSTNNVTAKGSSSLCTMLHDGVSHHPLGAGSYIFKKDNTKALLTFLALYPATPGQDPSQSSLLVVHIGAQPNNSPHAGTIVTFADAFFHARKLKYTYDNLVATPQGLPPLKVQVSFDLVDTAPDSKHTVIEDGVAYQRSHRDTDAMSSFLPDYYELLGELSKYTNDEVSFGVTRQADLLRSRHILPVLEAILRDEVRLGRELSPETERIALRAACPVDGCGIAEKHGRLNTYEFPADSPPVVTFHCYKHGPHSYRLTSTDIEKFEFNTPLRNLVRGLVNMLDTIESENADERRYHLRVTGSDYAGTYQEQLYFRQVAYLMDKILPVSQRGDRALPMTVFVYAPVIVDWSGGKLSKSLYVKEGAYDYLVAQKLDYLLSYARMKEMGKDVKVLFKEVDDWVNDPRKLYRPYTVEYISRLFEPPAADDVRSRLFSLVWICSASA
ncbi:hypothetical protein ONZ45_g7143 [Pleurotus djamor]|nr:hypothetical protein ONZ45_g7143 [Pleurotus djamor]